MISKNFHPLKSDNCLFQKSIGDDYCLLVLHVDDIAVAASSQSMIDDLSNTLNEVYEMNDSDGLNTFTGVNIIYYDDQTIEISQKIYIENLLQQYNLINCNAAPTPISLNKCKEQILEESQVCDNTIYRKLLGSLNYLVKTRPDICYAVSFHATKANNPTMADYTGLKRILRYLKGTINLGITFYPSMDTDDTDVILYCWCDASFATCDDKRSQSGYCFSLGLNNGMFFSRSFKQTPIALSSMEAEHEAVHEAIREIVWLRSILDELGFKQSLPTTIFEDNKSLITVANNSHQVVSDRTRHFSISSQYVKSLVKSGIVSF